MKEINSDLLHRISYEFFESNRYTISDFTLEGVEYSAICNNGWIKLHTTKGKVYWLAQNELGHITPDWKFHISVVPEEIPRAWNLVSKIFLELRCRTGMKTTYLKENKNTAKGREITIYIYKYVEEYSTKSEIGTEYFLNYSDEHSENFWNSFFNKIEKVLSENKISSNGLAKGDKRLGEYVSIRNEAYIKITHQNDVEDHYPPDEYGWNAANQTHPFNLCKFVKKERSLFIYMSVILLIVAYLLCK
jgi:hypothetical protein